MKTLLVTSEITFVPDNYAALVQGMLQCPQIGGLMIIKNAKFGMVFKSLGLMIGGAPSIRDDAPEKLSAWFKTA